MLVSEVITQRQLFDVMSHSELVELDEMFTELAELTNNWYVPVEYLPGYEKFKYEERICNLAVVLSTGPKLSRIWKKKLKILNNYFGITT